MIAKPFTFGLKMAQEPCRSLIDEMSERIAKETCQTLLSCRGVKANDMTEAQKYAVATSAGVPLAPKLMSHTVGRMTFSTVPCVIYDRDEGGWMVAWEDNYGRIIKSRIALKVEVSHAT